MIKHKFQKLSKVNQDTYSEYNAETSKNTEMFENLKTIQYKIMKKIQKIIKYKKCYYFYI